MEYKPDLRLAKYGGVTPIADWIKEAKNILEYIDEQNKATFIRRHLIGDAELEMSAHPSDIQNNEDKIFDTLNEIFGEIETEREVLKKMLMMKKMRQYYNSHIRSWKLGINLKK